MRRRIQSLAVLLVVASIGCNRDKSPDAAPAGAPAAQSALPDLDRIAESIVTRTAGVKRGDRVVITGSQRDIELLENLVVATAKLGAHPMLVYVSERMDRRAFDDVASEFDTIGGFWQEQIARSADVIINVDYVDTPDLLSHVPQQRVIARARAGQAANDMLAARNVRLITVGNDMYPTHWLAARYGMSREELSSFFWSAMNAEPAAIHANARAIEAAIGEAKELHVTDPSGTDFTVGITTPKWTVSDGVMQPNAKGAEALKFLPAGEVYSRVDAGTAEGVIVADRYWYQGKDIDSLRITFSKGKITSLTAKTDISALQEAMGLSENSALFSVIDFGINPGIKASAGATLRTFVPEGMVIPYFGNDQWAGGTNTSTFALAPFLANATVRADGRVIIENGAIKR